MAEERETKSDFDTKLEELRVWYKENPKMPEEIEPILLRRFLKCMYGDVEETKKLMELNYFMRNKHRNLFMERDPQSETFKISRKYNTTVMLPGLTSERYKLFFFRVEEGDTKLINNLEDLKAFHMLNDCRLAMLDINEEDPGDGDCLADGDIQITDIKNLTMRHMAHSAFQISRIHMEFLQEALPVRLKAMHCINCPSFFFKMWKMMKPFLSEETSNKIHFHTDNLETLYEHVPKDMLPEDYGGNAPPLNEIKEEWTKIIHEKRDYLMDEKQWKVELPPPKRGWFQ